MTHDENPAPATAEEQPISDRLLDVAREVSELLERGLVNSEAIRIGAEPLRQKVLDALDAAPGWEQARERLGSLIAHQFAARPLDAARAAGLLDLHVQSHLVVNHPRADRSIQTRLANGATASPVRFEPRQLVRACLLE